MWTPREGARLASVLPCLVLAVAVLAAPGAVAQTHDYTLAFRRGDANSSADVDLADAIFTFGWLFQRGDEPDCLDAADANDDGGVDISDGVFTLVHLFRGGGPLPSPGTDSCGRDPTPDDLSCASYAPCVCGGFAGIPCERGEFCDLPWGTCHSADLTGTCVPAPDACPRFYDPVCGCDSSTYGNDCERISAGAQKAYHGECGKTLEFETLAIGTSSGARPGTRAIRDAAEWERFWDEHAAISIPAPPRPEVDFDERMVVVFVREETSGGHHAVIDSLRVVRDSLRVGLTVVEPSSDCPTTDNITQPHHFVVTDDVDVPLEEDITLRAICCSRALDARGVGACEVYFGVTWTGRDCVGVSGCSCEGEDCDDLFATVEECREAFHGCPGSVERAEE